MRKTPGRIFIVFTLIILISADTQAQERGSGRVVRYYEAGLSYGRLSLYYASISGATVSTTQPVSGYFRYYITPKIAVGVEACVERLSTANPATYYTIAPEITFAWYDRPNESRKVNTKLYGACSIGYVIVRPADDVAPAYSTWSENKNAPAFQFTFLGIRVGGTVAGFCEFGVGYKGLLNLGINWRFHK